MTKFLLYCLVIS